jgi:hypothetical protein
VSVDRVPREFRRKFADEGAGNWEGEGTAS